MADFTKDKKELAGVLVNMSFGRLMQVAGALVDMNAEKENDRNVKTALGMAQTLYDWAEAQDGD